jgi:hypothetical protein
VIFRILGLICLVFTVACGIEDEESPWEDAPVVQIDYPAANEVYTADDEIWLGGSVADPKGLFDIETVSWHSEKDGILDAYAPFDDQGYAELPVILTPGEHRIWLVAIDQAGHGRSIAVDVTILPSDIE